MADGRSRSIDREWALIPRAEYDELWRRAGNWDNYCETMRVLYERARAALPADFDHAAMRNLGAGRVTAAQIDAAREVDRVYRQMALPLG